MKTYEDNIYDYVKNITIKNIKRLTSTYKNISSDLTVMNSLIMYTVSIHFYTSFYGMERYNKRIRFLERNRPKWRYYIMKRKLTEYLFT